MAKINEVTEKNYSASLDEYAGIVQGIAEYHQSIRVILITIKGSDPLRPEFGSSVYEFVDAPILESKAGIVNEVIRAINRWEKRIVLQGVTAVPSGSSLKITVTWRLVNRSSVNLETTEVLI